MIAVKNTLVVATMSTLIATVIGTFAGAGSAALPFSRLQRS